MRKAIVAGNWKMHGTQTEANSLTSAILHQAAALSSIQIILFPGFVFLSTANTLLKNSGVALGAQDIYPGTTGAFTGEISGAQLHDAGCQYVLIGHSERRGIFHEDLPQVSAKFQAALSAGLTPLLCVGETLEQREAGKTEAVIFAQLEAVRQAAGIESFKQAVIAYEPVWAIGTGKTATPEQAQAVHAFIRQWAAQLDGSLANTLQILYGGSVKADNAAGLFAMPDIDGALVGGASLDAISFLAICQAATHKVLKVGA
jgi:triosephosphate isomerase